MNNRTVTNKPILLVALGGNALIRKGQQGTIDEQFENLKTPLRQIARLSDRFRIIITHGNGPHVGNLLLQQECCEALPRLPLEILVAQTQGQIGFMIESTLDNELMQLNLDHHHLFVTLLSYVLVDREDAAFRHPSKPIGPAFPPEIASKLPYPTVRTAKGFRRVVASPKPLSIVEKREIKRLIELDFIVIACGGGGIPVIKESRGFHGIDAVIDKDLASSVLAREVGVEVFVIATDVPGVALNFGRAEERFLKRITTAEARGYLERGEFPDGSMGPKVTAAIQFLEEGGRRAFICGLEDIEKASEGASGTELVRGPA
jgi:carbamate kinase